MVDEGLIELTTPIVVNDELTLTHVSIMDIKLDKHRPWNNRNGFIEIWLAYGYLLPSGHMAEPEYEGIHVKLDYNDPVTKDDYLACKTLLTTTKQIMLDIDLIIGQFLIDHGHVPAGTIVTE